VLALDLPGDLMPALRSALEQAGIPWPEPQRAWTSIKAVWASKWNDRAFLSRTANEIPHEEVAMAVLIQPVIEAQYAFVIHTANPSTGAREEIFAEMVVGLGETLVGNHPGRAFGFSWNKSAATGRVLAFPSKSHGLFGGTLIFRSDSNAEDLIDYAGAGLYDSVTLLPPRQVLLDYTNEPIVWDEGFRQRIMAKVAEIGLAAEDALGTPQDIEGAYAGDRWHLLQARPQVGLRSE
jgi:alpha-glucan,water dikinase